MNQRALGLMFDLNRKAWAEISADRSLPQSIKTMVYLHLVKTWIPNFLAVAIAPLRPGLERFFAREVFGFEGLTFNYPSKDWWLAHARISHPPAGAGCDVESHVNFLTAEGSDAEFTYANVLKSGDVVILKRPDFEEECHFWAAGAGA